MRWGGYYRPRDSVRQTLNLEVGRSIWCGTQETTAQLSKTLSQWEIDALLNSIGSEDAGAFAVGGIPSAADRNIKLYDFRRPDKFSKEHIRAIQNIHETF